jgi:predicted DNA-binding transcriptional regulator YafY
MNITTKQIRVLIDDIGKKDSIEIERKRTSFSGFRIYDENFSGIPDFDSDESQIINKEISENEAIKPETRDKLLKLVFYHHKDNSDKGLIILIRKAIDNNTKIMVKEYHGRSEIKKNITLNPVHLDEKNKKVYCFDENLKINKQYNLDRMFGLMVTKDKNAKDAKWEPEKAKKDIFGFQQKGDPIKLKLQLTIFAQSLLLRQFPYMEKYLMLEEKPHRRYILEIEVFDIQPIARFITGLLDEIKILESNEAKKLIKEYIEQRVFKVFDDKFK